MIRMSFTTKVKIPVKDRRANAMNPGEHKHANAILIKIVNRKDVKLSK